MPVICPYPSPCNVSRSPGQGTAVHSICPRLLWAPLQPTLHVPSEALNNGQSHLEFLCVSRQLHFTVDTTKSHCLVVGCSMKCILLLASRSVQFLVWHNGPSWKGWAGGTDLKCNICQISHFISHSWLLKEWFSCLPFFTPSCQLISTL